MPPYMPLPGPDDNREEAYQFDEIPDQADSQLEEASTQPGDTPEAQLPPEARGEANGGPLGCCFGVSMGLLVSAGIASLIVPVLTQSSSHPLNGWLSFLAYAATVIIIIAATIVIGYAGWKIGRRVFREYEPSPRQVKLVQQEQRRLQQARRRRV